MTESFAQLFEDSIQTVNIRPGSIVHGIISSITKDSVFVDAGLKSESAIPIEQFLNSNGELEVKTGDYVDVVLDAIEGGFGETLLSRDKAKRQEAWIDLEKIYEEKTTIFGKINGKVKGGFTVELNGIRAFLPGSLVDVRPIHDTYNLEGKELEFRVIKLDKKRNNVVVSRRAVIESENNTERNQLLEMLREDMEIKGTVKNLTDYGAFIDLGGIDGLLHITDMAWKRVKHPNEIVKIGDEIIVKVLKFDKDKIRVSLGLKQLGSDPWSDISKRYETGSFLTGRITNLTDYGCFVEIETGIEGLVHISEMDWTNKNVHPSKVVSIGEIVKVMVLEIDENRRRISLGIKQCKINPWKKFAETYKKGDKVEGKIKSITDFGIFVGLKDGIDGLVHISSISWFLPGEEAVREYKKGDEISTIVLQVDADRERISLSMKQLSEDPFNNYISLNKKGSIVSGIVSKIHEQNIIIKLDNSNIEGHLQVLDSNNNMINDSEIKYKIGDLVEAKLTNIDHKNRIISLSKIVKNEVNEKKIANSNNKKQEENEFSNVMKEAFKTAIKND